MALIWQVGCHGCRYNSYLGGPYYEGYRGYSGTPRITLTLAVVPTFQEAVVVNNRAGRGGVSEQARQVRLKFLFQVNVFRSAYARNAEPTSVVNVMTFICTLLYKSIEESPLLSGRIPCHVRGCSNLKHPSNRHHARRGRVTCKTCVRLGLLQCLMRVGALCR